MSSARIELLQDMAVFGALSEASLGLLLEHAVDVTLADGEELFAEGDTGHDMFVLEAGQMALFKHWGEREHLLTELGPGDCVGEMALLDLEPRSATARAHGTCRAVRLPRDALTALYERDAEQFLIIQMNLARELSRRLRAADEAIFRARLGAPPRPDSSRGFLA